MAIRTTTIAAAAVLMAAASCSSSDERVTKPMSRHSGDVVLYSLGVSTDPYGSSSPAGFGVASRLGSKSERKREVPNRALGWFGGVEWIAGRRILVPRKAPPIRRPLVFAWRDGEIRRSGVSPVPAPSPGEAWSPDGRWIASEPVEPCKRRQRRLWECYRGSGEVYVQRADGSPRRRVALGHFDDWTPDGRLLITDRNGSAPWTALDVSSGKRTLPL